ncbi:type VII toxin-antitoxin system MntA family adenylyltransferase antitoxin [Caldicellulosiruptor morganii]|uniref:Nucleotidyltransferase domain-containing protein n=1 Tax=Caldicellulosiruptor morganii TaxID=1387555 RepID=A0ABY7BJR4_9FIRM|nr:nucleotidyltransferase domain-containing protein [Caldicellulosiruptor morganii]WAM33053.1 nucleotidyltransferase domain-containing protein [Caldicellulosiruptor morganii]
MVKDEIVKILREYFEKDDKVIFAYLFGSYARGNANKSSDIDVAAYIKKSKDATEDLLYQLDTKEHLEKILNKKVDFVILNDADPLLKHEVFSDGILVIDKDHDLYVDVRVKNFYEYMDKKRYLEICALYQREYFLHGKERDFNSKD